MKYNVSISKLIIFSLCVFSIVIASNRFWLETSDTGAYIEFYENFEDFWFEVNRFEPAFSLLAYVGKALNASSFFFLFVIACLGVGFKYAAISKYAPYAFLSLLVYFSKYYLVQDMIQIRAGVATGIFLLSIEHIKNRNFKSYLFYICVAAMFHYSAAIYILLYFVCDKRLSFNKFLLIAVALLAAVKTFDLNSYLIEYASDYIFKMQIYADSKKLGIEPEVNILSVELIMNSCLFALFYFLRSRFIPTYSYYEIWLRAFALSLCMSMLFANFPVLSLRLSELFGIVSIFLFPLIIDTVKEKYIGLLAYATIILALTYNYYFKQGMIF